MLIIYAVAGVLILAGIGFVVYLLVSDSSKVNDIEKMSITDLMSSKNMIIDLSKPALLNEYEDEGSMFKNIFKKFFIGNNKIVSTQNDVQNSRSEKDHSSPKNRLSNILSRFSLIKSKQSFGATNAHSFRTPEKEEFSYPLSSNGGIKAQSLVKNLNIKDSGLNSKSEKISKNEGSPNSLNPSVAPVLSSKSMNSDLSSVDNLQSKMLRLERMLKEQTDECSRLRIELGHEIEHRNSYEKVKILLEEELAETKEAHRVAHNDFKSVSTEVEKLLTKQGLMEEKILSLEKRLMDKDNEMKELLSRSSTIVKNEDNDFNVQSSVDDHPVHESVELINQTIKDPWSEASGDSMKNLLTDLDSEEQSPDQHCADDGANIDDDNGIKNDDADKNDYLSLQKDVFGGEDSRNKPLDD